MSDAYVHPTAVIDDGASIGAGSRVWHFTHVMSGAVIGRGCVLGQNVFIGKGVRIGDGVKIQNNVSVYEGVEVGDDVFLGPSVVFTNVMNPRSAIERKNEFRKTLVRKGVTIGANATILCGIELGEYAFIGAGAMVAKAVRPFELWLGNPARCIGWMSAYGSRLYFDEQGRATCPESGEEYVLEDKVVRRL